jgi:hypothetical protein
MIPKPGTILENGAVVLTGMESRCGNIYVLCHWNKGGRPDGEYVSWRFFPDGSTEFGHYSENFFDAVNQFKGRLDR